MPDALPKVLIAEDEADVREFLRTAVRCDGYAVQLAEDGEEALRILAAQDGEISAVLLDLVMPRMDGLTALREIRALNAALPVYVISASAAPGDVVEAMKAGATDFLAKPLTPEEVRRVLPPVGPPEVPAAPVADTAPQPLIFLGNSPRIRQIRSLLRLIAASEAPVLIQGETGSGKEVLARELHALSPRAGRAFLKLNCAALPSELVESELFGYERGAFTGAFQRKAGMFEIADGGTLLLDEIGDMDFKLQAKLLQVLQDRAFLRLGGKDIVVVDVRVMASTHRNLEAAAHHGNFRLDLYYRLNVMNLELPPLRERTDDIPGLAEFFLQKYSRGDGPVPPLPHDLRDAMLAYPWPGNVRELENIVRRYLMLEDADALAADLRARTHRHRNTGLALVAAAPAPAPAPQPMPPSQPSPPAEPVLEKVARAKLRAESDAILSALNATRWNRKRAAQLLNIDYKALLYKMKKLSIAGKSDSGPRSLAGGFGLERACDYDFSSEE